MEPLRRAPLEPPVLAQLVGAAGLTLTDAELAAMLPPIAAIRAGLDALDALPLADSEPAAWFRLEAEQS